MSHPFTKPLHLPSPPIPRSRLPEEAWRNGSQVGTSSPCGKPDNKPCPKSPSMGGITIPKW